MGKCLACGDGGAENFQNWYDYHLRIWHQRMWKILGMAEVITTLKRTSRKVLGRDPWKKKQKTVSAQWLGNILGNYYDFLSYKYGHLRWIWADLFMIFLSSLRTPNVGLCCAWGENLIRITTLVDLDNATVAGVCKTFVNYLYNVTFFLEQTFHSRIFVFELEHCRFMVLQSTTIAFFPDKFYESLIWIGFYCTSIWSIDVWNTTLSQTHMFANAHICIYIYVIKRTMIIMTMIMIID